MICGCNFFLVSPMVLLLFCMPQSLLLDYFVLFVTLFSIIFRIWGGEILVG